jgi:hypothetical protein
MQLCHEAILMNMTTFTGVVLMGVVLWNSRKEKSLIYLNSYPRRKK